MASYKTKFNFRSKIIEMIEEGKSNKEISDLIGCNPKYPCVVRKELKNMTDEEREALVKEIMEQEDKQKHEEPPEQPNFRTPYTAAKGRFIRSGY